MPPGGDDTPTVPARGPVTATIETHAIAPAPLQDRYVVRDTLGRGGMGEVVLATDLQIGREVAIKRMHPELRSPELEARFIREARVQGQLQHPAVVPVYALTTDEDGRWYFVMKRLAGVTLEAVLHDQAAGDPDVLAKHPRERLLRAFIDVCRAIELAHSRGIVHRDLKPSNIMLGEFGEVYVLDWGIARVSDGRDSIGDIELLHARGRLETATGVVMGTQGYMPPEQIASAGEVGTAADVYALGCVLFEILAGEPLHPRGEAALASTVVGVDARPSVRAPNRQTPPELDDICMRAVALDSADRPDVGTLAREVERYMDGDRDLAARRALAATHHARARDALAAGDTLDARRRAMRDAGRALALDPDLKGAAELVSWLVLQPPAVALPEVEASLAADDDRAVRSQAKLASISVLGYFAFIPLLAWIGVRDWTDILVLSILSLACSGAAWWVTRHPTRGPIIASAVVQSIVLGWVAHMFSPFLVAPAIGIATMVIYASQPQIVPVRLIFGLTATAIGGTWILEQVGVLARSMHVEGNNLVIVPPAMRPSEPAMGVVLVLEFLVLLASTAYVTTALGAVPN